MTDHKVSAEQRARDLLERLGIEDAQSYSSGDLVELANLIVERDRLREPDVDKVAAVLQPMVLSDMRWPDPVQAEKRAQSMARAAVEAMRR